MRVEFWESLLLGALTIHRHPRRTHPVRRPHTSNPRVSCKHNRMEEELPKEYYQVNFLQCYEADATDLEAYHEEVCAFRCYYVQNDGRNDLKRRLEDTRDFRLERDLARDRHP
ncbi:hypothetical protein R1sor_020445 [Riccia sorocarpa]|uniref:Uncharacterized protein n=1 Tax=Riccia sorocarpa TaxID=122646 RepID=A0ABD3IFH3_9MARC